MPSCDISKQKRGGELLNASLGTSTRRPRPAASRVLKVEGLGGTPACRGQSRSPAAWLVVDFLTVAARCCLLVRVRLRSAAKSSSICMTRGVDGHTWRKSRDPEAKFAESAAGLPKAQSTPREVPLLFVRGRTSVGHSDWAQTDHRFRHGPGKGIDR
jgi:hypothetical protein